MVGFSNSGSSNSNSNSNSNNNSNSNSNNSNSNSNSNMAGAVLSKLSSQQSGNSNTNSSSSGNSMMKKGGRRKKGNGHKINCGCPICKNMRKSKKRGGGEDKNSDEVNAVSRDNDMGESDDVDENVAKGDDDFDEYAEIIEDGDGNEIIAEEKSTTGGKKSRRKGRKGRKTKRRSSRKGRKGRKTKRRSSRRR